MSRATFERQEIERFYRYWEDLFEEMPEARRKAVEAMGKAVEQELHVRIQQSDLESDAMGTVISWQELRFGSRGGYAAITPRSGAVQTRIRTRSGWKMRQNTYQGKNVTAKQVTGWLERGHGVGYAKTKEASSRNRRRRSLWSDSSRTYYVKARQFYSFTKLYAWERARDAAEQVLEQIADG